MGARVDHLSQKEKIGYGVGDLASSLVFSTITMFLMFYYTDIYGLSAALVGTLFLVTRLWDAITDPLMGAIADRTRSRHGKFRPYLLWMSVPLAVAFLGLFWLPLGQPAVFPFFGGFIVGYLAYDYTHYATHFVRARTWIGKGLRKRHLQHHFACPDRWYGVSSPLWDYVFRTHVPRGVRPSSPH